MRRIANHHRQSCASCTAVPLVFPFALPLLVLTLLAPLLNGCSPMRPAPVTDAATPAQAGARKGSPPPASASTSPVLPPAGSGRGGYYMDDGPADVIPEGLANTPDAEPRIEALLPRANRPYTVFGKWYTPVTDDKPFRQRGIGSWYGKKFHGQKTSSGEPYDMFKMTAAHPTLPIPSYARVTHVASGKQVIVRINDRGPFHSGRIIDLSYTAALKLGYVGRGSGEIEVERLLPDEIARINSQRLEAAPPVQQDLAVLIPELASPQPPAPATVASEKPQVLAAAGSYYLQLGAWSQQANAEQVRQRLASGGAIAWPALDVVGANGLFRLFGGPWASRAEAQAAADALRAASSMSAIIVQR
ncbi:MAG: septal ring lytic transglycosylase RlpA family protein [Paucimonas sp.]|nr:septal ring lytic transglycosylase RlpA family protein [Paucimonas sp.]